MAALTRLLLFLFALLLSLSTIAAPPIHLWEMQEIRFTSDHAYANPYTEVTVWIDLKGPGFNKRVYGFWNGGKQFLVRLVATTPGNWSWISGSSVQDAGLNGRSGSFNAVDWTEIEKNENPLRHGFLRASANHHALIYADSTPYLALGDTWFSLGTNRFKWYDDERVRGIGPNAGFKDYVRLRKSQGFNWISLIAAYPNWKTDDSSWLLRIHDSASTLVRTAWMEFGTGSAKNMDNEGGKPFFYPGKVPGYENFFPDMDRLNPEYFKYLDRKIAYLNDQGFIPFLEAFRRDASILWKQYYDWPHSCSRYIQYIFARYQAYNVVLSPVHLDILDLTLSPDDFVSAIYAMDPGAFPSPFANLLSANANPSTLENWGEHSWVTLHQIGNGREHNFYWYLTEIYHLKNPAPALNGEPYYSGFSDPRGGGAVNYTRGAKGGTARDDQMVRSGMYGSFLSGGLAGHVYGAEGIWGGDIEAAAPVHMWDAFQWSSAAQMQYLKSFAFSIGYRYQELEPLNDLVSPNRTADVLSFDGWAYCARTPDKNIFMIYFEKDCPRADLRGARLNSVYRAQWFDPRKGTWMNAGGGRLPAGRTGIIKLPDLPNDSDWGLRLVYEGPEDKMLIRQLATVGKASSRKYVRYIEAAVILVLVSLVALILFRKKERG